LLEHFIGSERLDGETETLLQVDLGDRGIALQFEIFTDLLAVLDDFAFEAGERLGVIALLDGFQLQLFRPDVNFIGVRILFAGRFDGLG
jgi:hypothetical protein